MAGEANGEKVAAAPSSDVNVDLNTAVMANGEMVKKLTFHEPTGNDMMQIGERWPVNIDWQSGEVTPNPLVMANVMAQLAAVPPSTIKMMKGKDFSTCAHALMGFFVPAAQAMQ
jgi:hypothetical protein